MTTAVQPWMEPSATSLIPGNRSLSEPRSRSATAAMAGVSNVGSDRNWTGSQFNQVNWYAFGRLAWNPEGSARAIADEMARFL